MPPSDFLEATLDSISVTNVGFILFLKVEEDSRKVLPVFIGANEAQSIAQALGDEPPPRPLTHDLLKAFLDSVDAVVTRVEITDLREGTFYGKVHILRSDVEESEFDARPSDAIALAVRFQAPILVARKVFEDAAVPVTEKPESPAASVREKDESEDAADDSETGEASEEIEALTGDAPAPSSSPTSSTSPAEHKPLSPVDALKAALDAAVRAERYEEAARLRDALKRMNAGN
jgi:bifunctional DNase/RNase